MQVLQVMQLHQYSFVNNNDVVEVVKSKRFWEIYESERYNRRLVEILPEAVVRFQGINELEELSEQGEKMTDVIREVLEFQAWKKRRCSVCKGLRFVKKDKIKALKKRMKSGCTKKNI